MDAHGLFFLQELQRSPKTSEATVRQRRCAETLALIPGSCQYAVWESCLLLLGADQLDDKMCRLSDQPIWNLSADNLRCHHQETFQRNNRGAGDAKKSDQTKRGRRNEDDMQES
eukprot:763129-Hanusia_phi.AAC.6